MMQSRWPGHPRARGRRAIRVLFVCLGNICRSPTAEGVLRQLAAQRAPGLELEVDSAGTADYHIGAAPDPRSQRAALRRGIDLSGLRARQVTAEDFERFDYILAMDRQNLRELQSLKPKNSRAEVKLFLEFAPGAAAPGAAAPQAGSLEVPDPYYGGDQDFERVLDLAAAASRGFLDSLQESS
jgi:protein-tyrosine phosphatase